MYHASVSEFKFHPDKVFLFDLRGVVDNELVVKQIAFNVDRGDWLTDWEDDPCLGVRVVGRRIRACGTNTFKKAREEG